MRASAGDEVLWEISVVTTVPAEERVAEFFTDFFGVPACIYTESGTDLTIVKAYLKEEPAWDAGQKSAIRGCLALLKKSGIPVEPGKIRKRKVRSRNWAESWKRHFKPFTIGDGNRLLVKPPWSKRRSRKGEVEIILNPGLSFGTGHHPTTAFCLECVLDASCRAASDSPLSFLDTGCGSGILSIAAARLGFHPIHAFDYDPEAIRIARDNARENGVEKCISFHRSDLTQLPRNPKFRYDVVAANLMADLLMAEHEKLTARVKPGGQILLAGVLATQFEAVKQVYESAGCRLFKERLENEWKSGSFWVP